MASFRRVGKKWQAEVRIKGRVAMDQLCADDIRNWMTEAGRTVSSSTVRRESQVISGVIERARQEWRWILPIPAGTCASPDRHRPETGVSARTRLTD